MKTEQILAELNELIGNYEKKPELQLYISDCGRAGDYFLVAEVNGEKNYGVVGAVLVRIMLMI